MPCASARHRADIRYMDITQIITAGTAGFALFTKLKVPTRYKAKQNVKNI